MAQCFFMESVAAVFGPVSSVSFGERWSGCRPYFENYTVDASILDNTAVFIWSGVVTYN